MKQLTNNQMKELKGQLNDQDYRFIVVSSPVVVVNNGSLQTITNASVCKAAAIASDNE